MRSVYHAIFRAPHRRVVARSRRRTREEVSASRGAYEARPRKSDGHRTMRTAGSATSGSPNPSRGTSSFSCACDGTCPTRAVPPERTSDSGSAATSQVRSPTTRLTTDALPPAKEDAARAGRRATPHLEFGTVTTRDVGRRRGRCASEAEPGRDARRPTVRHASCADPGPDSVSASASADGPRRPVTRSGTAIGAR